MLYVALAATGTLAVSVVAMAGLLRSLVRQHARERAQLVDQVCHLSGRTWTPPPVDEWRRPAPVTDEPVLIASPEQWPE